MEDQRISTILWRGKWLIVLSLVFTVALGVLVTQLQDKVYAATAIVQVNSQQASRAAITEPFQQLQAGQTLATAYATVVEDRSFLARIRGQVGRGRYTVSQLEKRVSASPIKDTNLFRLQVEESSPEAAKALAADVARAFLQAVRQDASARTQAQKREIQAQIADLTRQIERLAPSGDSGAAERVASLRLARAALTEQLGALVAANIAQGGSVTLSAPPSANDDPVRPKPLLNVLAGVMLGLLLGIVLSWLRTRLDRGLHSAEEAEELLSAPVLATIPLRKRYLPDDAVVGEAFDVLRANLAFLSLDQALQVITFTSYNPGEGKTATVEGLAYAAVRGGMTVLIVDGDTRSAALSEQFSARGLPGLTSVIVGSASLDEAVLEVEPGLALLAAGPTPPNPPSLLSSHRTREVIAELRERHSLIIIDSPPVAHLADATILAGISDGIVLVARVGITARADLPAAAATLRHSPTPIVGAVVLRPQMIDETYYPTSTDGRGAVWESLTRS